MELGGYDGQEDSFFLKPMHLEVAFFRQLKKINSEVCKDLVPVTISDQNTLFYMLCSASFLKGERCHQSKRRSEISFN